MNKRLIGIIAALALVVGGSLVYSNLTKQETKTETTKQLRLVFYSSSATHHST